MSLLFAHKGTAERTFNGAHSRVPLEIRGHWHAQGPQPVADDGGVPGWVADLFDSRPDLMRIALSTKLGGVVWSRPHTDESVVHSAADEHAQPCDQALRDAGEVCTSASNRVGT